MPNLGADGGISLALKGGLWYNMGYEKDFDGFTHPYGVFPRRQSEHRRNACDGARAWGGLLRDYRAF